jgi:hypothetical protein
MWDRKTLSEYNDLELPGLDAPMPAPTDAMEVPLPSDSYLFDRIRSLSWQIVYGKSKTSSLVTGHYQVLSFSASGNSGLITRVLLPTVETDTPGKQMEQHVSIK